VVEYEQVAGSRISKYSHAAWIIYLGVYSDKDKFKWFNKVKYLLIMPGLMA
jgi:hypothetical protein